MLSFTNQFCLDHLELRMIKHLFALILLSASALHEAQTFDWMLWVAQERRAIKADIDYVIHTLSVTNNQMESIEEGELCEHPVEVIDIHQNRNFPKITRKSLRNCSGIKQILIHSNPGLKFEENAFADLTTLEALVLEHIDYKHVTQTLTRNLFSLKNLTISACGVNEVDQNAFGSLENLEHLDLSHNNLRVVYRLFEKLGKLKSLDLFGNKLTSFPWDELKDLRELEWLALGKNNIAHYNVDKIVKFLPKLKAIFLDFQDGMPCSIVNELRNEFRTKAGHIKVYEGIGTGRIPHCPVQSSLVPLTNEV